MDGGGELSTVLWSLLIDSEIGQFGPIESGQKKQAGQPQYWNRVYFMNGEIGQLGNFFSILLLPSSYTYTNLSRSQSVT